MKAISIRQPFAYLVVNGHKDIENRTWQTKHRGPVLIHTGLNLHQNTDAVIQYCDAHNIPLPELVDCGGIIGIAEIVDVVTTSSSPWFSGPYGFVLVNPHQISFIELKGRVGVWETGINPPQTWRAAQAHHVHEKEDSHIPYRSWERNAQS